MQCFTCLILFIIVMILVGSVQVILLSYHYRVDKASLIFKYEGPLGLSY